MLIVAEYNTPTPAKLNTSIDIVQIIACYEKWGLVLV
jgi:hypothetical protein